MIGNTTHWIGANAGVVVAAVSALFALQTYRRNANTKRAEFLLQLHHSFFVEQTYKQMRDLLDNQADASLEKLSQMVLDEPAELTDFLNFFELVAYFEACGTVRRDDVDALLGYYLHLIKTNDALSAYIENSEVSFEYLDTVIQRLI